MQITSYGGVREVTGSMHLLTINSDRILLDCGMFQGRRKESAEKNRILPIDPGIVTNVVLSHAHIDHSGRIPLLTKQNFAGRIICTRVTRDACEYLLMDAGHIQESDAQYLNYKSLRAFLHKMLSTGKKGNLTNSEAKEIQKKLRKNGGLDQKTISRMLKENHLEEVEPLYTVKDAEDSLEYFDGYPYRHPITIGKKMTATFYDAGHILGSAITMIQGQENGRKVTVCYTGDIGRFDKPILEDPTLEFDGGGRLPVDLLIMESTYGNRFHDPVQDISGQLKKVIKETVERGGTIVIPAFAYGRTQELIYMIHELYDKNEVPKVPIYIDSPLANKITRVFGEHAEAFDQETHEAFLEKGENPFAFSEIKYVSTVEESMALMRDETPHIVISASGMCEAGRILHHLRYKIHNPNNTILIVGFMAQHTLGRRILDIGLQQQNGEAGAESEVKILNKLYPVRANIVQLGGFSAHADRTEMLRFLKESNLDIKKIAVVHGEEEQTLAFMEFLNSEGFDAVAPRAGEPLQI
jgi:metallo-beta-lactamase family protein